MRNNIPDVSIPASFVAALEQVTQERDKAIKEVETYRRLWLDYREKAETMEKIPYKVSDFSTKDLVVEIVRREEELNKKISMLKDRIYDMEYSEDNDD